MCCGQRRRPDAANAACLSLARSLTECAAVRRGAQRSQRPGARHVSVQQRLRAPRGRRAVLSLFVALARECGLPPGRRTCRAVARGRGRQLRARSQRGIAAGLDGIWYVLAGTPDSEGGWDRSGVTGTTAVVQLIPSCNNFDSNSARNRIASINSRAGEDRVGRRREETTPSVVQGQLLAPVRITVLTTTRSL